MPRLNPNELRQLHPGLDNTSLRCVLEYTVDPEKKVRSSLSTGTLETYHCEELVLFELLAGSCTDDPVIPRRGFPENISSCLFYETHLKIVDAGQLLRMTGMRFLTIDDYRKWHSDKAITPAPGFALPSRYGYLFDPEIRAASYVSLQELDGPAIGPVRCNRRRLSHTRSPRDRTDTYFLVCRVSGLVRARRSPAMTCHRSHEMQLSCREPAAESISQCCKLFAAGLVFYDGSTTIHRSRTLRRIRVRHGHDSGRRICDGRRKVDGSQRSGEQSNRSAVHNHDTFDRRRQFHSR